MNAGDAGWRLWRLRRDGGPPLRFSGRLVADQEDTGPGVWHAIALYATASGHYAASITAMTTGRRACRSLAEPFAALDAALAFLERHDAARDVWPLLPTGAVEPPVELAIEAAALSAFRRDVVRRYRIGVGRFLADLAVKNQQFSTQR